MSGGDACRAFGELFAVVREALGVTQYQLAARLGVSQSVVSRWEGGSAAPSIFEWAEVRMALREAQSQAMTLDQFRTLRQQLARLELRSNARAELLGEALERWGSGDVPGEQWIQAATADLGSVESALREISELLNALAGRGGDAQ